MPSTVSLRPPSQLRAWAGGRRRGRCRGPRSAARRGGAPRSAAFVRSRSESRSRHAATASGSSSRQQCATVSHRRRSASSGSRSGKTAAAQSGVGQLAPAQFVVCSSISVWYSGMNGQRSRDTRCGSRPSSSAGVGEAADGDAGAALAPVAEHALAVPVRHEVERLLLRVLHARALDVRVVVGEVDEAGAVAVAAVGDRPREGLAPERRAQLDDLPGLHVGGEADDQVGVPAEQLGIDRRRFRGAGLGDGVRHATSAWIRPAASFSGPPERPARTARISARIETAVSAGVDGAHVEAAGAGDALERPPPRRRPRAAARAASPGCGASRARRRRTPRSRARPRAPARRTSRRGSAPRPPSRGRGARARRPPRGQATTSSSALGIRSRVANLPRASATIVRQPTPCAARQSASAVSTAPKTSRRGGGPEHVGEDGAPVELEQTAAAAADQLAGERGQVLGAVAEPLAALQHEQLAPAAVAVQHREQHRVLVGLERLRAAGRRAPSSCVSTRTSISPPHGSPTSNASSSAMP